MSVTTRKCAKCTIPRCFWYPRISSTQAETERLVDKTKTASKPSKLVTRLFLHQVETHGDECQPADEVQTTHDVLLRAPRVEARTHRTRHVVAEPDCGQRDETEVGGDEWLPVLGQTEEERTEQDVTGHEQQADADWYAHLAAATINGKLSLVFRCMFTCFCRPMLKIIQINFKHFFNFLKILKDARNKTEI